MSQKFTNEEFEELLIAMRSIKEFKRKLVTRDIKPVFVDNLIINTLMFYLEFYD